MKKLSDLLGLIGILIIIYSFVGRFVGGPAIGLGLVSLNATTGLLIANSFILAAILIKVSGK